MGNDDTSWVEDAVDMATRVPRAVGEVTRDIMSRLPVDYPDATVRTGFRIGRTLATLVVSGGVLAAHAYFGYTAFTRLTEGEALIAGKAVGYALAMDAAIVAGVLMYRHLSNRQPERHQ